MPKRVPLALTRFSRLASSSSESLCCCCFCNRIRSLISCRQHPEQNMSGTNMDEVKEQEVADSTPMDLGDGDDAGGDQKASNENHGNPMPSAQQEEAAIKKKYGGILPKKTPLISKDHERAYFDSADWALGKQGAKPKGPLEALRPKLQPTPHQQGRSRRSAYSRGGEGDGMCNQSPINFLYMLNTSSTLELLFLFHMADGGNMNISSEDQLDSGSGNNTGYEDQIHHHE
ncbi:unnamed protein product [Malus baccata var. baccata]